MDIHVDIRRFLEIHAWTCYGFSDQGGDFIAEEIFSMWNSLITKLFNPSELLLMTLETFRFDGSLCSVQAFVLLGRPKNYVLNWCDNQTS